MRVLCLDVGDRRIGMAVSDPTGSLARPIGHLVRKNLRVDAVRVSDEAKSVDAQMILVGMPVSLNGTLGPQARKVSRFIQELASGTDLPVKTQDERFSTAEAQRLMVEAGRSPSRSKGDLDAASAAVILQEYLDNARTA